MSDTIGVGRVWYILNAMNGERTALMRLEQLSPDFLRIIDAAGVSVATHSSIIKPALLHAEGMLEDAEEIVWFLAMMRGYWRGE